MSEVIGAVVQIESLRGGLMKVAVDPSGATKLTAAIAATGLPLSGMSVTINGERIAESEIATRTVKGGDRIVLMESHKGGQR